MIEYYASPAFVNNNQDPWLIGEGVATSGSIAIPSLNFDFVNYSFPAEITFTRASSATYFDSAGTLTTAANNVPRLDYDPATLAARGLLIEEQRVNSIRNNTMQGAVAGTPGTLPTNWTVGTSQSLTTDVVAVGTSGGINYIDLRISGTPAGSPYVLQFEPSNTAAAASGQTWTESAWFALVGGSLTNVSAIQLRMRTYTSGMAFIAQSDSANLSITSTLTRFSHNYASLPATTAFIEPALRIGLTAGQAVNVTLRIGLPQLEQGAFATSVIPTTGAAATRSVDVASVNTLTPWFNATEGTLYGEVSSAAITVAGTSRRIANINDGTEADRITVGWAGAVGVAAAFVTDNSVAQASFTAPSGAYPFPTKVALAYKAADFQAAVNGSAFATVSSGTVPTVNRMTIGDVVTGTTGAQNINGHIRRITYYPRRLSNAELQAITA